MAMLETVLALHRKSRRTKRARRYISDSGGELGMLSLTWYLAGSGTMMRAQQKKSEDRQREEVNAESPNQPVNYLRLGC